MKKISYTLISAMLLSMLFILSCGGSDSNDNTPPVVEDIRFNVGDTVRYYDTISKDPLELELHEIIVNPEDKDVSHPDILVIGHPILLSGVFRDEGGLSTIYVHIWGDTIYDPSLEPIVDTCYRLKRMPELHMFGQTERIVEDYSLAEVLPYKLRRSSTHGSKEVTVRPTGEKDEYLFSISCVDIAGNQDTISFNREPLIILHRETIIKEHQEKLKSQSRNQ